MNINKFIIDTLSSCNVPVYPLKYTGAATTYITFFEYLQKGEEFADNKEMDTGHYIQVDVWSTGDYTTIVNNAKTGLKNAGCKRTYETEMYEEDTKIFHKVIRVFLLEKI